MRETVRDFRGWLQTNFTLYGVPLSEIHTAGVPQKFENHLTLTAFRRLLMDQKETGKPELVAESNQLLRQLKEFELTLLQERS